MSHAYLLGSLAAGHEHDRLEKKMPIHILQHPLGKVYLSVLRDKTTDPGTFRTTLGRLASLVGLEATSTIQLKDVPDLQSPWASYTGSELGERIGLAPILRSGVGMEEALLSLLPGAPVYHLGLYRDPISLQAIEYYSRLPQSINVDRIFILDPMVATGNTALAALKMMKEWGLGMDKVCFLGIIASRKALEGLEGKYPDVHFYFAAVDEEITDKGYVIPGCGDVGDRLYNSIK